MTKRYESEGCEDLVERHDETVYVIQGKGFRSPGSVSLQLTNTGNGYIAFFPSDQSTVQDYYVCLDYSQARDLVLGLAEFKDELGFV